jgi:DNA-binding transcriptional LysR family regulator
VRNTRHFGRAASHLFLTQAAVSARIRQLESDLGVSLFVRERNNIRLSPEGERLVPHAETVLMALARARRDVSLEDPDALPVHLLVRSGIWSTPLQTRLHALLEAMPDLVLRVDSQSTEGMTRMLLDRTADIALLFDPPSVPELESRVVGELSLRLFSSRRRDSAERALARDYVYLDWGQAFGRFHARRASEAPAPRLQTNLLRLALDYLESHGGSCYLPESQRRTLAEKGFHPVGDAPGFLRPLHAAWHSDAAQRDLLEGVAGRFAGLRL